MHEITGALIGIALVLTAVFVPMAFFGGSTGVIYRQFSITIVSAMVLSVLVALVLTPGPVRHPAEAVPRGTWTHKGFFGWFNRNFDRGTRPINATARKIGIANRSWRFLRRVPDRRCRGLDVRPHAQFVPAQRGPGA
jgi:multidrug efflux pump